MIKWQIKGYDSTTETLSGEYVADDSEVQRLLRELAASGLTPREIFEANTGTAGLLHVARTDDGYMCGSNPHFTAKKAADENTSLHYRAGPYYMRWLAATHPGVIRVVRR